MRKIVAIVLMVLGMIVLVAATGALVRNRLSLPAWSVQTEGRWTAYGMHKWAFLVGELPLGLALVLGGYLLWPSRPSGLTAKRIGSIILLVALGGLVAFAGLAYGLLRNVLGSSPPPSAASELSRLLLAGVAGLVPLLAMTVLAGGVAWKSLRTSGSEK